jgi:hypothetical protein
MNAENSTKLIQAITWHRSTSSKPSSCKSLVASSSKGSSTWTEYKNDLFDDYGGMDSGSHSLTLGRLYAWEKKLYEEVKVSHYHLTVFLVFIVCSLRLHHGFFVSMKIVINQDQFEHQRVTFLV